MKNMKKLYWGIGALVALVLAAWFLQPQGRAVEVVEARHGVIIRTVTETGYVQPGSSHNIYASQGGQVTEILVETGQKISAQQTLMVLENLDLTMQSNETRSQLSQTEAAIAGIESLLEKTQLELENAQENLSRLETLYHQGAVSQAEYRQAQLAVETTQRGIKEITSRLDSARAQKNSLNLLLKQLITKEDQLTVKSPAEGLVIDLAVKAGQTVLPGTLLAVVGETNQWEVKTDILSDELREIQIGQKAAITAPILGGNSLEGEVSKIHPQAVEKLSPLGIMQRRVPVYLTLPHPGPLQTGYEVKVSIETMRRDQVLLVPREALRTKADGSKEVLTVVNGRIKYQTVETGLQDSLNVEIIRGLTLGDLVIRDGTLELAPNAKVKALQSSLSR